VDLTHAFSEASVYWPTDTLGFTLEQLAYGPTAGGFFYAANRYAAAEHGGIHLDAPVHFAEGRQASDEISLSSPTGPGAAADVSGRATADYQVSVDDLSEDQLGRRALQVPYITWRRRTWLRSSNHLRPQGRSCDILQSCLSH
jgi:kynurenine formamidase